MVRANSRRTTIKDMLKNVPPLQPIQNSEEEELRLALQLSKQEQIKEQKRILEQLTRSSSSNQHLKKRRIIQLDDNDEDKDEIEQNKRKKIKDDDDWFQPIPKSRISLSKNKAKPPKVKKEENQVILDIDDVSTFLNTKEEEIEEASYDLTSLLSDTSDTRNDKHTETSMISDSDSDCSFIDLVEKPWIDQVENVENIPNNVQVEEDDGYLSPLEGFTNLNNVRDSESYSNYYNQFRSTTTTTTTRKPRKKRTTTTPKKKKYYNKFWAKKKK